MVITIFGTRPQFVKAKILSEALNELKIKEFLIDTNQHYSKNLTDVIAIKSNNAVLKKNLNTPVELFKNIEPLVLKEIKKVKFIIVFGDTNSTVAGALLAKKYNKKLIHIEAGERSNDLLMPEEQNRILVDALSDICFCVSNKAKNNLIQENIFAKKLVVGDILYDAFFKAQFELKNSISKLKKKYIYFTLHRHENTNRIEDVQKILNSCSELPLNIIWPMHPKLEKWKSKLMIPENFTIIKPVKYLNSLALTKNSEMVITDSGGIQREAYWSKVKCITMRNTTEWPETLKGNCNILVKAITTKNIDKAFKVKPDFETWSSAAFGKGNAAHLIAKSIKAIL